MSGDTFSGFGQFSRPDIGLISDGFQNLSEIFESDKRTALENILLSPESLDLIYNLSKTISREDLRSTSGLSTYLLSTLHQLDNISRDRILEPLEFDRIYLSPKYPLGGASSNLLNTPNVVLFNGSIKCKGAFYRTNVIGQSLFQNPEKRLVSLSTSRSSLFNSESDQDNPGFFKTVSYPGTIRVRRRSHVNRVFLPENSFINKPDVLESPSHTLKFNIVNGEGGSTVPLKLLATKNSPLKIFCRLTTGRIKFTFTDSLAPYFFGYQIQPVQQIPNTTPVNFLNVQSVSQPSGSETFTLDIDIRSTGYQTIYDLYLYLYLNVEKVKGLEFEDIGIKEFPDGRDLGLIGFNNLEILKISGGSMSILPVWLKTLGNKLRVLDLRNSGESWRSGPMSWFDIRNPSAVPSFSHPLYTAVSYLTIPKSGPMINESGDDWSDVKFRKYILDESRTAGTDYRQFTNLTELYLGDRFKGLNPKLQDVFPNLRILDWKAAESDTGLFLLGSKPPSIRNTGSFVEYNISGSGAAGTIYDVGLSTDPASNDYISKYKMLSFNISGRLIAINNITGYIGNPAEDWENWYKNTVSIDISRTRASINIQSNIWERLRELRATNNTNLTTNIILTPTSSPLRTPVLEVLLLSGARLDGQMFSLGSSTSNTSRLRVINLADNTSLQPIVANGVEYFLPEDFAPIRPEDSLHRLVIFRAVSMPYRFRFREKDLINLNNLSEISWQSSLFTGIFPIVPTVSSLSRLTKLVNITISYCNFYDLRNLSVIPENPIFSRDLQSIVCNNQNTSSGGTILPSFRGTPDTELVQVDMSFCLPTFYPSSWHVATLRGSCVRESDPYTEITGLTIQRTIQNTGNLWTEKDNLFRITGANNFNTRVLVNDSIRLSLNGPEVARVLSVSPSEIIIDRNIVGILPSSVYFYRNTVSITEWFSSGFLKMRDFRSSNNRLSGSINFRTAMSSLTTLDLSQNLIDGYVSGSMSRVFTGNNRSININLSFNSMSISSVRQIIEEISAIDSLRRFSNCTIRLGFNKIDLSGKYANYSQSEVFPVTISKGKNIVTSLFRNEQFYVYETSTSFDEEGNQTVNKTIVGTKTVPIPGILVSGVYYKTRTDETQIVSESPLAVSFKNLRGIRIDLGFNYISPSAQETIISTTYSNQTTRNQSIIDAGLNPADLVNP
jgi:hypothetical protein